MKFASSFEYVNRCDQRVKGSVDEDDVLITIIENGDKEVRKLYFLDKQEIETLIELLNVMKDRME